ncbi:MAG: 4-alpha-glucanotransferase [Prevotellaceae bacterium]|jgi:4-alpha-glucanotransferase|nr:4-alpha-glucanotransferase [Prevotellaceae bacterium]
MTLSFNIHYEASWAELLRMNNWQLGVLGNQVTLGNWQESAAIPLDTTNFRVWKATVDASNFTFPVEYKFVIFDSSNRKVLAWETRQNRYTDNLPNQNTLFTDNNLHFDIAPFRGAGTAVPVFSLRSAESFGVGEFLDLKKMIDWAALTEQKMLQILPVNDTTLTHSNADSYPYNTLSVFALHPMYLRLEAMGKLNDKAKTSYFQKKQEELNRLPALNYEEVNCLKWEYFHLIYKQRKKKLATDSDYQQFLAEHAEWLIPYAVFSFCRDAERTPDFERWTMFSELQHNSNQTLNAKAGIENFAKTHAEEIGLYQFIQYHLHLQLIEVHRYAQEKGIFLKGDIPIGVSPYSVDVWYNPKQFKRDLQAGAPPDDFSVTGQNWGFPTYNWDEMQRNGFSWWRARLRHMSIYFDAYRIDHILGFFRIWSIPKGKPSLLGHFDPAMPLSVAEIEAYGLIFDEEKMLHSVDKEDPCQVLFVPDCTQPNRYHPRISIRENTAYLNLTNYEQQCYARIYEDFFHHRHNGFWQQRALHKLPELIASTPMLCCGEDLGMIPATVPEVMQELHILSLEVERMPKIWGIEFSLPASAPYLSVCTTSTHDMSPLRLWWTEDAARTQRYFNAELGCEGIAPAECEPWIVEKILARHLQSPAAWVILPVQDWLAVSADLRYPNPEAERINVPDNPQNLWCYRMHLTVDEMLAADCFNEEITKMIREARA